MIGKTIAHYKILEKIGSGGMGVVYKAEDTKLERVVALKFLPPELVRDEEARERFIYEARAASSLDHPNICTIHEINESDGHYFIAMAFVEGESLKEKLKGGPLKLEEAISIAGDIASGLYEAHEKGIIHRDIKPSNIMVTPKGQAKIMDFGLAKFPGRAQLTKTGTTLGTVAYMSPEQARGMEVDHRTDLWSLGIILYEMLTGRQPFSGEYEQAVMYSILNIEAEPVGNLRTDVPTGLERIVKKTLDKNRDARYQRAEELIGDIKKLNETLVESSKPAEPASPKKNIMPYAVLAACVIVVLLLAANILRDRGGKAPPPESRQITYSGRVGECTISPDGNYIAYTTRAGDGMSEVWVKDLGSGSNIEIYSSTLVFNISWSPDGADLLLSSFTSFAEGATYLLPRLGGNPREIIDSPWITSTWSPDGNRIAYVGMNDHTIKVLDISAGVTDTVSIEGVAGVIIYLAWSPNGERVLMQIKDGTSWLIQTARFDGLDPNIIFENEHGESQMIMHPCWAPDGSAVYYFALMMRGNFVFDVMKIAVDKNTGKALGEPARVLSSLHSACGPGLGSFYSIAQDGKRFAYVHMTANRNLFLATVDGEEGSYTVDKRQLTSGTNWKSKGSISPDGSRTAFAMGDESSTNIYVMSLEESDPQPRQLTFMKSISINPVWSPDGETIAFYSDEGNVMGVWIVGVDGGAPKPIESSRGKPADDELVWAPGREILFRRGGLRVIELLDPESGIVRPLIDNPPEGYMFDPCWSPDGKHVAFFWNRPEGGQQHMRTWIVSVEDGTFRMLTDHIAGPITWSTDGAWVYIMQLDSEEAFAAKSIYKVPSGGGEPEKYIDLPFITAAYPYVLDMAMDGRTLVYLLIEEQSDVWLIDNFDPEVK